MIRFLKSTAFKIFAVAAAALLAGSLFAVASRSGSSPLTSVTSFIFSPISRLSSFIVSEFKDIPVSFRSASALLKENEELRKIIDSLTDQLVDYEQLRQENERYKQQIGLKEEHNDYVFAQAAIIGRDAADNLGSFTLNKGSAHDISVNDPVIYGNYLVGVVSSVTPTQCTVNTILNPKVNVSAYEVRTRDLGYVTSSVALAQQGRCHMPGLPSETSITAGGTVCTSGVGGIFPRDLIIGNIVDVVDGTVDISASAIIEPGVDFSAITDVFILTSFDGQNQN